MVFLEYSLPYSLLGNNNNICDLADQHKHPAVFVLGNVWPESDHIPLNIPPFQGQHLAFPPTRVIGKSRQVLEEGGKNVRSLSNSSGSKNPCRALSCSEN